jgi:hypothetical protein
MLRPSTAAVSPDGRALHIASDTAITSLRRDPATGGLSRLARPDACVAVIRDDGCRLYSTLSDNTALVVSSDSRRVYVAGQSANAVTALRRPKRGGLRALAGRARCVAHRARHKCGAPVGLVVKFTAGGR